jgi:hypothetical protein
MTNITGIHKLVDRRLSTVPGYQSAHLCEKSGNYENLLKELDSGVSTEKDLLDSLALEDSPGAKDPYEAVDEWTTSREYTGSWASEFKIGGATFKAGVTYTSRFEQTIKVTEYLPRGYHYISRYRSARELPQQWTARKY